MSHPSRRSFSWSAALRDIKTDRAPVVPGLLAARGLATDYARSRSLPLNITTRSGRGEAFAVSHKFDRAAIMTVATLAARDHQKRHGGTWAAAMSVCLKAAWQIETAAPSLHERSADLRASLRLKPAAPAPLPAPGSPEAMAAWHSACNEHSKRAAPLHEYTELKDPTGGFWTKGSLGRALETGEISVPEYARLHPIASERELRLDQIGHELNTAALFALAYAGEYPATSPVSLNEADDDAKLIRLGHLFEAARVREGVANEACNAAGREADRLMPLRPACLIYRASDNGLRVYQEMMMPEALAGREVRMQDIEWLRRKMPMHHEVLRPIREGERAHMDHPGRRFDIVPHPEAQARAEEIVAAWDAWYAEKTRIYEKHVTEALENAADEAGRAAVALVEQIAGLPAHTAAGFRVKLRALTHYRREILLAEIPAEPDPDQILTHSLWRDMRNEGSQDRTGEPQPTELPLSALVPMVDFTGASMRELLAIRDAADMLCNVASAAMSQYRNRLRGWLRRASLRARSGRLSVWMKKKRRAETMAFMVGTPRPSSCWAIWKRRRSSPVAVSGDRRRKAASRPTSRM